MSKEILEATRALAPRRASPPRSSFVALEDALLSAYKKPPGAAKYARVEMDRETGDFIVYELIIPERLEAQLIVETIDEGTVVDPETGESSASPRTPRSTRSSSRSTATRSTSATSRPTTSAASPPRPPSR